MSQEIAALTAVVTLQQQAIEVQAAQIREQSKQIGELAAHVGLLVQSVAQLLGEETGTPVPDEPEPQRTDLDGNTY